MSSNTRDPYEKMVSLSDLFVAYFRMGLTAFGPAIMAETKKNIGYSQEPLLFPLLFV